MSPDPDFYSGGPDDTTTEDESSWLSDPLGAFGNLAEDAWDWFTGEDGDGTGETSETGDDAEWWDWFDDEDEAQSEGTPWWDASGWFDDEKTDQPDDRSWWDWVGNAVEDVVEGIGEAASTAWGWIEEQATHVAIAGTRDRYGIEMSATDAERFRARVQEKLRIGHDQESAERSALEEMFPEEMATRTVAAPPAKTGPRRWLGETVGGWVEGIGEAAAGATTWVKQAAEALAEERRRVQQALGVSEGQANEILRIRATLGLNDIAALGVLRDRETALRTHPLLRSHADAERFLSLVEQKLAVGHKQDSAERSALQIMFPEETATRTVAAPPAKGEEKDDDWLAWLGKAVGGAVDAVGGTLSGASDWLAEQGELAAIEEIQQRHGIELSREDARRFLAILARKVGVGHKLDSAERSALQEMFPERMSTRSVVKPGAPERKTVAGPPPTRTPPPEDVQVFAGPTGLSIGSDEQYQQSLVECPPPDEDTLRALSEMHPGYVSRAISPRQIEAVKRRLDEELGTTFKSLNATIERIDGPRLARIEAREALAPAVELLNEFEDLVRSVRPASCISAQPERSRFDGTIHTGSQVAESAESLASAFPLACDPADEDYPQAYEERRLRIELAHRQVAGMVQDIKLTLKEGRYLATGTRLSLADRLSKEHLRLDQLQWQIGAIGNRGQISHVRRQVCCAFAHLSHVRTLILLAEAAETALVHAEDDRERADRSWWDWGWSPWSEERIGRWLAGFFADDEEVERNAEKAVREALGAGPPFADDELSPCEVDEGRLRDIYAVLEERRHEAERKIKDVNAAAIRWRNAQRNAEGAVEILEQVALTVATAGLGAPAGAARALNRTRALVRGAKKPGIRPAPAFQKTPFATKVKRAFIEDRKTFNAMRDLRKRYPRLFGRDGMLKSWQGEHKFIKQRWYRGAPENRLFTPGSTAERVLQRLGDAGWNIVPMPARWNRWLYVHKNVDRVLNALIGGGSVAAVPGSYNLGKYIGWKLQEEESGE